MLVVPVEAVKDGRDIVPVEAMKDGCGFVGNTKINKDHHLPIAI